MSITVSPLAESLSFGARIEGVDFAALEQEAVRQQIRDVFEECGLILFPKVEASGQMHVALSGVFGPLKEHPVPSVGRVDSDQLPGVIDMQHNPEKASIVELEGKRLTSWLPWHFDHCYNDELNRAGVLRAIEIAPEGGLTMFADGIDLYRSLSPELREQIENAEVVYTLNLDFEDLRFGRPKEFRSIRPAAGQAAIHEHAKSLPRAVHPAVWTRASGEKVLHISPWMAAGIKGHEDAEGDALLDAVCREISEKVQPYVHRWTTDEMLIWDNWRMLHAVAGMDERYSRRMQRTTIKGDYGLGYFEGGGVGDKILEMTV